MRPAPTTRPTPCCTWRALRCRLVRVTTGVARSQAGEGVGRLAGAGLTGGAHGVDVRRGDDDDAVAVTDHDVARLHAHPAHRRGSPYAPRADLHRARQGDADAEHRKLQPLE